MELKGVCILRKVNVYYNRCGEVIPQVKLETIRSIK